MYIFHERLRELRTSKKLTQKQLSIEIQASERGIQHYELAETKPSYDAIVKLCKYFNVSADYLLGLSDNPEINK